MSPVGGPGNPTNPSTTPAMKVTYLYTDGVNYCLVTFEGPSTGLPTPPPRMNGLTWCSEPQSIVLRLNNSGILQRNLAEMFGVKQQTVSRWINEYAPMHLTDEGWRLLAKLATGRLT